MHYLKKAAYLAAGLFTASIAGIIAIDSPHEEPITFVCSTPIDDTVYQDQSSATYNEDEIYVVGCGGLF
jgi:hypothetical protein